MKFKELIEQSIERAERPIKIAGSYTFNHYNTLDRIELYKNSQYVGKGHEDDIFWNLGQPRVPHFNKNIDLDTKNLVPYAVGETNFWQVWVLKMKFHKWKNDNGFALTIDDMIDNVSAYGSAVWKVTKDKKDKKVELVNLKNLYFDTSVKYLKDSSFVVEKHLLSKYELKQKEDVWDDVQEVIDAKNIKDTKEYGTENTNETDDYEVYEFWGEYEDEDGKVKYTHIIGSIDTDDGVIFFEDEKAKKKELPYYDFHIAKYTGRWLRIGVYERLFNLQVRVNKLCNQNAQTTEISSLLIMKSQEPAMAGGNIINQLENGTILDSADLQQVGMDNRNLASFLQELALIERQADKLCMTPEMVTGEDLPSNITFRGQALLTNAAKSAFKMTRDGIGMVVSEVLLKEIFPSLIAKWNVEEVIDYIEDQDDVYIYDALYKTRKYNEKLFELAMADLSPATIDPEVVQMLADEEDNKERKLKHGKDFFNFDYGIRLNITGEEVDKQQKNDAYNNILQWIQADKSIQDNPYFKSYVEFNNISARKMKAPPQQMQQPQQAPQQPKKDKLSSLVDTQ